MFDKQLRLRIGYLIKESESGAQKDKTEKKRSSVEQQSAVVQIKLARLGFSSTREAYTCHRRSVNDRHTAQMNTPFSAPKRHVTWRRNVCVVMVAVVVVGNLLESPVLVKGSLDPLQRAVLGIFARGLVLVITGRLVGTWPCDWVCVRCVST